MQTRYYMKIKELFNSAPSIQDYLIKCGVSEPHIYLYPSHNLYEPFENYNNYNKAYTCFMEHINNNDNICLYIDIDQDGYASSTIIYQLIQTLSDCKIFAVFNSGKVHNLTDKVIGCAIQNDCKLLISPDAGSNDFSAHKTLKDNEIDCICLDHHMINKHSQNAIVVNCQTDGVINHCLSGGGVSYKFANYVCKQQKISIGYKWVDLCALSIVADVMSLVSNENRMFVNIGLQNITNPFLKYVVDNVIKDELTPKDISWNIAPLINSLIRQDNAVDKMKLFNAFVGIETNYKSVLAMCRKARKQQSEIVKEITEDAIKDIDDKNKFIIAFCEPSNYTGLVSGKISSSYLKPVLLVHRNDKDYVGSLRSPIPMRDTLKDSGLVNFCSGHDCAAGVSFPVKNKNKLQEYLNQLDLEVEPEIVVLKSYDINKIPSSIFDLYNGNKDLYGEGIPEPQIHIKPFKINGRDIQEVGNGSTIRINCGGITLIKFFTSKQFRKSIHTGDDIDLTFEATGVAQWNEWNGNITKQIVIDKIETKEIEMQNITWQDLF